MVSPAVAEQRPRITVIKPADFTPRSNSGHFFHNLAYFTPSLPGQLDKQNSFIYPKLAAAVRCLNFGEVIHLRDGRALNNQSVSTFLNSDITTFFSSYLRSRPDIARLARIEQLPEHKDLMEKIEEAGVYKHIGRQVVEILTGVTDLDLKAGMIGTMMEELKDLASIGTAAKLARHPLSDHINTVITEFTNGNIAVIASQYFYPQGIILA